VAPLSRRGVITFLTVTETRNEGSPLGRRRFLKLGVVATAFVATSGTALAWFHAGYGKHLDARDRPIALTTKELAIVKALVRALLPADGELPSGESLRLAQRIDEEVWAASVEVRRELSWGLQLLEHAPRFYDMRGRLTEMSEADAAQYFERVLLGPRESLRQVAIAMRQLLHIFYYANPAAWRAIGYDGPLVPEAVVPDTHKRYLELLS
jgi:hypothetical protein